MVGKQQLQELQKVVRELWGCDPVSRLGDLQRHIQKPGDVKKALQTLEAVRELDARRTLLLERMMWSAVWTPVMRPRPRDPPAAAAGESNEATVMKDQRTGTEAAEYRAELDAVEALLAVAEARATTSEQEKRGLRAQLLELEKQVGDLQFEAQRVAVKHEQGLRSVQATAERDTAATVDRMQEQLKNRARQLDKAHEQLAAQRAEVYEAQRSSQGLHDEVARLQDQLRAGEGSHQECQRRIRELQAELIDAQQRPDPKPTPVRGLRSGGRGQHSRSPSSRRGGGLGSPGRGRSFAGAPSPGGASGPRSTMVPADETGEWLVWSISNNKEGHVDDLEVVAWIAGVDCDGVWVAIDRREDTVRPVGWWVHEGNTMGYHTCQVSAERVMELEPEITI
jgi:predicted  nucleic acid-binding Zn-ribbon protein